MLTIRKAQKEDCRRIYDIRMDEEVRKVSLNTAEFTYESHEQWFERSLANPLRKIFVTTDHQVVIGVVRFDLSENLETAVVSIFFDEAVRGRGIGTFALQRSAELLKQEMPSISELQALVKPDNLASIRLFEKAGFRLQTDTFSYKF